MERSSRPKSLVLSVSEILRGVYPDWRSRVEGLRMTFLSVKENIVMRFKHSLFCLLMGILLTACTTSDTVDSGMPTIAPTVSPAESACTVTEPVWAKPPEDSAVLDPPAYGYYFLNADRSIWACAWWTGPEEYHLRAGEEGNKVGWFRPAGAELEITGQRLDGQAPPLEFHAPCCYPIRFQASGLVFPTQGCWEVTARAAESELTFVVWVDP
jgi:hypothetical protein